MVWPEIKDTVFDRGRPVEKLVENCYIAQFTRGGITEEEYQQALSRWKRPHGITSDADPRLWFSIYDSDIESIIHSWTPEEKTRVEDFLSERVGSQFIKLEERILLPPWPTYDEMTDAEEIVNFARVLGLSDHAIGYEKQNLNREEIVTALEDKEAVDLSVAES